MCVECSKFLICFSSVLLTKFSKKVLWTFRDQAPADRHNFSAGYTWSKDANVQKAFGWLLDNLLSSHFVVFFCFLLRLVSENKVFSDCIFGIIGESEICEILLSYFLQPALAGSFLMDNFCRQEPYREISQSVSPIWSWAAWFAGLVQIFCLSPFYVFLCFPI